MKKGILGIISCLNLKQFNDQEKAKVGKKKFPGFQIMQDRKYFARIIFILSLSGTLLENRTVCDQNTGQCSCLSNRKGRRCDSCSDGKHLVIDRSIAVTNKVYLACVIIAGMHKKV